MAALHRPRGLMKDVRDPRLLWLKGGLFLGIGVGSAGLLLAEAPAWRTVLLLVLMVWGFCRAYYFAFYVIEHYIDADYRFSGLGSFVAYILRKKSRK